MTRKKPVDREVNGFDFFSIAMRGSFSRRDGTGRDEKS